jgi:predicted metal-binding membrane protein
MTALSPGLRLPARAVTWVVLAVAALAWVSLTLPSGHDGHGLATWSALGGWAVMVVAMMLPPALPMLTMLRALVGRRRLPMLLVGVGAVTYVGIWTVVGAVLLCAAAAVQMVAGQVPWLGAHPAVLTGAAMLIAGVYQFSPVKDACLTACRSPRSFAVAHWRGVNSPATETATIAATYAMSCVGCCVALMGVSVTAAGAALPVMVLLAVVMAAERLLVRGRRLVRPVGFALLAGAIALVAGSLLAG